MVLFKKKKPKASLEMPPPPPGKTEEKAAEIPELFHEVKFPKKGSQAGSEKIPEVVEAKVPSMPELPEIPEIEEIRKVDIPAKPEGPIFTKSREYQEILGRMNQIKESIEKSEDAFKRLSDLKNEKDKVFSQWKKQLEDVQRKLIYVEKSLFEV